MPPMVTSRRTRSGCAMAKLGRRRCRPSSCRRCDLVEAEPVEEAVTAAACGEHRMTAGRVADPEPRELQDQGAEVLGEDGEVAAEVAPPRHAGAGAVQQQQEAARRRPRGSEARRGRVFSSFRCPRNSVSRHGRYVAARSGRTEGPAADIALCAQASAGIPLTETASHGSGPSLASDRRTGRRRKSNRRRSDGIEPAGTQPGPARTPSPDEMRRALGQFASGVTVVTGLDTEGPWVSRVSRSRRCPWSRR